MSFTSKCFTLFLFFSVSLVFQRFGDFTVVCHPSSGARTLESDISTSVVSNLHFNKELNRIEWDNPAECTTITGWPNVTSLFFTRVNDSAPMGNDQTRYSYYNLSRINLEPFTRYNVRAHVIRDYNKSENSSLYRNLIWMTKPAAPPAVTFLETFDADLVTNSISLRWKPPNPPRGEIEFYNVSIDREIMPNQTWRIEPLGMRLNCELWEDYVCFKDITLLEKLRDSTAIQVYAKNKNVAEVGNLAITTFNPGTDFLKAPAQPTNLKAICKKDGTVTLKWEHPFSATKITRFLITVKFQNSRLLDKNDTEISKPLTMNKKIHQGNKKYRKHLRLKTSTNYRVCVVAYNRQNTTSTEASTDILVPDGFGFVGNEELQVDGDGTLIRLKVPAVANATHNTTINVVIKGPLACLPTQAQTPNSSLLTISNYTELSIAKYFTGESTPKFLTIGTNQSNTLNLNCSLNLGENYTIEVNVEYTKRTINTHASTNIASVSIILTDTKFQMLQLVWFGIPVILAICLVSLFIWWRFTRRRISHEQSSNNEVDSMLSSRPINTDKFEARSTLKRTKVALDEIKQRVSSNIYACPFEPGTRSVSVDYFEEYANKASESGILNSQFMLFPRGLRRPCSYGKLPENVPKNRDTNLIPYDDTRVVLQKLPGDLSSDYINASYIQGYHKKKEYIATQAPMPNTINDFWRMIWQEKVYVICMLTNLTEGSEVKCERYWPEIGVNKKYGTVKVLNMGHETFADYVVRTLKISSQKFKRRVTHLQYTSWPHHGVPMYFQSLLPYLRKLSKSRTGNGLVVVHGNTGTGRTGTLILFDICVNQAIAEKAIDVLAQTTRLRHDRADMISTSQQYLLAHILIAESIESLQTQVHCTDDLPELVEKLKNQLPCHIKRLNEAVWQEQALFSLVPPQPPAPGDFAIQRLPEANAVNPDVVFFKRYSIRNGGSKHFISAVGVDGLTAEKQYIASQLPTKSTSYHFWRMIAEKNVELVIMLQTPDPNGSSSCTLMPRRCNHISAPCLRVEIKSRIDDQDYFTTDKLQLTDTSEGERRSQPVTVLTCTGWESGKDGRPPSPGALVEVWRASENIPRKKGPTLVLCHDGITGCGLYLAMSFLLERMAVERDCDVISAVRAVRRFQPEFVQDLEQFHYLYDAAVSYVECFETYSNFS